MMNDITWNFNIVQLCFLIMGATCSSLVIFLLIFRADQTKSKSSRHGQTLVCLADVFWQVLCIPVIILLIVNRRLSSMFACQMLGSIIMGASITSYTLIATLALERYKNIERIRQQKQDNGKPATHCE